MGFTGHCQKLKDNPHILNWYLHKYRTIRCPALTLECLRGEPTLRHICAVFLTKEPVNMGMLMYLKKCVSVYSITIIENK